MSTDIAAWAAAHLTAPWQADCVTALMLKILDGKCRMGEADKAVIPLLYDALGRRHGERLDPALHGLIARARDGEPDEARRMAIYEQRLYAETMISRPVMKGFKAALRAAGILADHAAEA